MPNPDNAAPVSLFYSCAHEDQALRDELAGHLCAEAVAGQVLVDRKIMARLDTLVDAQPAGPFALKGLAQPVPAFQVLGWVAG